MSNVVELNIPGTGPKYYSIGPVVAEGLTYGVEHMLEIFDDIKVLHKAHWDEVEGNYLKKSFDPDYGLISLYEAKGRLVLFTVRDEEHTLVGNAVFVLGPNLLLKGEIQASDIVFYLKKELRGSAAATCLLSYVELVMARLNVAHMHISDKSFAGGRSMERLLTTHGFVPVSKHYMKEMQE